MTQEQKGSTVVTASPVTHQIFCAILIAAVIATASRATAEPAARPMARPSDGPTNGTAGDGELGRVGTTQTVTSSTAISRALAITGSSLQKSGLITPGQRSMSSTVLFGVNLLQTLHQSRRRTAPPPDGGRAVGVRGTMAIDWIYLEF